MTKRELYERDLGRNLTVSDRPTGHGRTQMTPKEWADAQSHERAVEQFFAQAELVANMNRGRGG